MKKNWWLTLALGPVLFIGFLSPPRFRLALDPQLSLDGPILAPWEPLGSLHATAFLGEGWSDPGGADYRQTRSGLLRGSDLRFYLDAATDVRVRLEGRLAPPRAGQAAEAPEPVEVWMGGQARWKLAQNSWWGGYEWDIPAAWLQTGANTLELRARRPTQWRTFQVWPRGAGRAGTDLAGNGPDRLAFARSRSYPIRLQSQAKLLVPALHPWLEPGAAPLQQAPRLLVRLDGAGVGERSWTLNPPASLRLEATGGPARLSVTALGPEQPTPGQAGVILAPLQLEAEPESSAPARRPPNLATKRPVHVVVYLIDTLRADHLGCYGYRAGRTPNLDALARDGVLFAQCTAQSGWTKPATASVLTSLPARLHGAMDFGDKLRPEVAYLPQVLQQAGYHTRAVVTNPFVTSTFGFERGFDSFQFLPLGTSRQVNAALFPWLQKKDRPNKPFFLYLHTLDPHLPYAEDFSEKQALALQSAAHQQAFWGRPEPALAGQLGKAVHAYDADVSSNDAAFGELVAQLKRSGLYEDTLILVVSDHGEEFLDHGRVGHSNSLYQELLHVPLIIKFPNNRGAGTRVAELWQQIDVAPTILRAGGLLPPPAMQGQAYQPGLAPTDPFRPALISMRSGVGAERWGQGTHPRLLDMDALRSGDWIYLRTLESVDGRLAPRELYDLQTDPQQRSNQAWIRPELTVALHTALNQSLPRGKQLPSSAPDRQVETILRSLQYLR